MIIIRFKFALNGSVTKDLSVPLPIVLCELCNRSHGANGRAGIRDYVRVAMAGPRTSSDLSLRGASGPIADLAPHHACEQDLEQRSLVEERIVVVQCPSDMAASHERRSRVVGTNCRPEADTYHSLTP